jgi:hypothetical protein
VRSARGDDRDQLRPLPAGDTRGGEREKQGDAQLPAVLGQSEVLRNGGEHGESVSVAKHSGAAGADGSNVRGRGEDHPREVRVRQEAGGGLEQVRCVAGKAAQGAGIRGVFQQRNSGQDPGCARDSKRQGREQLQVEVGRLSKGSRISQELTFSSSWTRSQNMTFGSSWAGSPSRVSIVRLEECAREYSRAAQQQCQGSRRVED